MQNSETEVAIDPLAAANPTAAAPSEVEPVDPPVESRTAPGMQPVRVIPIAAVSDDDSFRVRDSGDVSALATDIARVGQLYPIDVRPTQSGGFQIVCGFRRAAALRFLQRDEVVARVHEDLSDDDAVLMALASAVHVSPTSVDEISQFRDRLQAKGMLSRAAADLVEQSAFTAGGLAPEATEQEIDADELAADAAVRLSILNQDVALLMDVYEELDPTRAQALVEQLSYAAELVAYLREKQGR